LKQEGFYPAECAAFPAGKELVFVRNRNDGRVHEMAAMQFALFRGLIGAQTVEEHVDTLVLRNTYNLPRGSMRALIDEWIDAGLLRSVSLLWNEVSKDKRQRKEMSVAVVTCERTDMLAQWLESRVGHPHFSERSIPLMVCDDSREKTTVRRNRELTDSAAKRYPGALRYYGMEEKSRYISRLLTACATEGVDGALIRFASEGPPDSGSFVQVGANRNTALLLAGGRDILFSDDDIHYRAYRLPQSSGGGVRYAPAENLPVRFFPSLDECMKFVVPFREFDLPGEIVRHLGIPLNPLPDGNEDLSMLSPSMARCIEEGNARIGMVTAGHYGARWFEHPSFITSGRLSTNDPFYEDEEIYHKVMRQGINISAADVMTAADGLFLQGGSMALDMELAVPPFFPVDRHEDPAFGVLLRRCNPESYVLHLPAALEHDLSPKSMFASDEEYAAIPGPGRFNQLIVDALTRRLISGDGEGRLREAGCRYRELALLSQGSFGEYLKNLYQGYVRGRRGFLEYQLDLYQAQPLWWANDMKRTISALESSLEDPLRKIPSGFQRWIGLYGELLEAWPLIRRRAAEISPLAAL
jgi:hypothetical protein